jgi:hypothetical protein
VLVYFGEGIQLGFGDIDWSFEHIPGDSLGTGRSGERTGERIVASSGREEILGVDGNGLNALTRRPKKARQSISRRQLSC